MKKIIIISFIVLLSLLLISCSSQETEADNASDQTVSSESSDQGEEEQNYNEVTVPATALDDGSGIESVHFSYLNMETDVVYDANAQKLLNEIRDCTVNPQPFMVEKVGQISVNYGSNDGTDDFAELYLGSDNNIYAIYITGEKNDYAYMLDPAVFE